MADEKGKEGPQRPRVTESLPPPKEVGGLGITHSYPKPTQIPPVPSDLCRDIPNVEVILAEARKKFPEQSQLFDLCKHVFSEITRYLGAAVRDGKLGASQARIARDRLFHSLLVYNDDGPRESGFSSLSDEGYRLEKKVRNSEEWATLAKAIADATEERANNRNIGVAESESSKQRSAPTASKKLDPEVAKRRALVKSNSHSSAGDLCEIFDRENVPLPPKWQDAGFKSWAQAFKDPKYRGRIRVLIAKDKKSS